MCKLGIVIILVVLSASEISSRPETSTVKFNENVTSPVMFSIITIDCNPGYSSVEGECRPIIQTSGE